MADQVFCEGGGFSIAAPMPSWQQPAVKAYLNSGVPLPAQHYYNRSGRAYPDVSAVGNDFITLTAEWGPVPVGGTSVLPC